MLHDQDLTMFLWDEACNIAIYLQNKSLHKVLGRMTPEEAFTGKKPKIGHIRIFGCLVYYHVPVEGGPSSSLLQRRASLLVTTRPPRPIRSTFLHSGGQWLRGT
jgi:hypothetical protein